MDTIEAKAGVLRFTHRTPPEEIIRALTRAAFSYYQEINANQEIIVNYTFEIATKPIWENNERPDRSRQTE